MLNMKKSLLAAAALAALFASSAFAADADVKADNPTMAERTAAILQENRADCYGANYDDRPCWGWEGHRRYWRGHGPQLTQEQIKERQQRREEWAKMTPQQRQAKIDAWHADYEERREAALNKLTKEQREEVENFIKEERQHRQDMRSRLDKMTTEQIEALRLCHGPYDGHRYDRGGWRGHHGYRR